MNRIDANFDEFYNIQSEENKRVLNFVLDYIKDNRNYEGMNLRTTKYRINKLSHYLTDLDGTLMIDLLYRDISKLSVNT